MALFLQSINLLAISFVLLSLSNGVNGIPEHELFSMVSALRSSGYHLFSNALMTSDIHYELLSGSSLTFFAPTDSALFALDITTTASDYVETLRFHIVPLRFSVAFLRSLPSGSSLPTLLPNHQIFISKERMLDSNLITVNGVDVVFPGLFYSRDIAVHGLSSILILRQRRHSVIGSAQSQSQPPAVSTTNHTNTYSPSMNVTNLDGISPEFSPAEAPIHGSLYCHDQCPDDSAETPTINPPEEGSPVNLEDHPFDNFLPVTAVVAPPEDRLPVDYSSYADSPDAQLYWEPTQTTKEFVESPGRICDAHEKGPDRDNGIHGVSPYCSVAGD